MAEVVRYVNTASTAGGDGTTNNTTGTTRAYATLQEWYTAEQTNLVTAGDNHTVYCCGSTADSGSGINVSDSQWTTGSGNELTIAANPDHANGRNFSATGALSTSHYRYVSGFNGITTSLTYFHVIGIQVHCTNNASTWVNLALNRDHTSLDACVCTRASGGTAATGLSIFRATHEAIYVRNCIVTGNGSGNGGKGFQHTSTVTSYVSGGIYNCTFQDWGVGVEVYTNVTTIPIYNCCSFNNTNDYNVLGTGSNDLDYFASDDLDGANTQDMSNGTPEATYWANNVNDYANSDVTPVSGSVLNSNGVGYDTESEIPIVDINDAVRDWDSTTIGAIAYGETGPASFIPNLVIY